MLAKRCNEHIFCLCTRLEVGNGLGYELILQKHESAASDIVSRSSADRCVEVDING